MVLEVEFTELYRQVKKEIEIGVEKERQKMERRTHVMKVKRVEIVKSLNETVEEVEKKYKEALKFWREAVEIYSKFISKYPGSTQIRPPESAPRRPAMLEEVKGYMKLFSSISDDEIELEIAFLKEMFNVSAKTVAEAVSTRNMWMNSVTGSSYLLMDSVGTIGIKG